MRRADWLIIVVPVVAMVALIWYQRAQQGARKLPTVSRAADGVGGGGASAKPGKESDKGAQGRGGKGGSGKGGAAGVGGDDDRAGSPYPPDNPFYLIRQFGWGSESTQFGHDVTKKPGEGPMAIAVESAGNLVVLDQVNHRVQRLDAAGRFVSTIKLDLATPQDLVANSLGLIGLLDRQARVVEILGRDDKPRNRLRIDDVPTGIFSDGNGFFLEDNPREVVALTDADGMIVADKEALPGRPMRSGKRLRAEIVDRSKAVVAVQVFTEKGEVVFSNPLRFSGYLLRLVLVDSDLLGNIYIGVEVGRQEKQPPFKVVEPKIVLTKILPNGVIGRSVELPSDPVLEESLRQFCVAADGTLYRAHLTADGVALESFHF